MEQLPGKKSPESSAAPDGQGEETVSVEAVVESISFSNEDNGWCVLRMRGRGGKYFSAVGTLLGVREGDRLNLRGSWVRHPKYGEQFDVRSFLEILPSTEEGIRRFLASGRVKGVGPVMARRLVGKFGTKTLDVIASEPARLEEVSGIGPIAAAKIHGSWMKQRSVQRIMVFLAGHGIAPGIAVRLHRRYGESALAIVRENPYRLAEEVYGVGFLTADRIARSLGLPLDAPERLEAGIIHTLSRAARDGHVYLPRDQCLEKAGDLLDRQDGDGLREALDALQRRHAVVIREIPDSSPAVFLARFDRAEESVARGIERIISAALSENTIQEIDADITEFERKHDLTLAGEQRRALSWALSGAMTIITGGPGTGKTTLIQGIVEILDRHGLSIALAAPTGRAAKRMEEATGRPAKTLHRLLEFNPKTGAWTRNADHPLKTDCIVVDEVSMLDIELAARLIEAVTPGTRLVLVGDSDQLPSVGPGDLLADLIGSGKLPVCRLERIFRQGKGSLIAENAHRINQGHMPQYREQSGTVSDFYFAVREDPEDAVRTAVELVSTRIPRHFGFDPIEDIQLLSPMHRGELGVENLNKLLQDELSSPAEGEIRMGHRVFRKGDKVMQLRNNYDLEIYNGDTGRVVNLDEEERELIVDFSGKTVQITAEDLEDLTPAYACTIHKAQGSEYPAVVITLHTQHHIMLQRNLLYTAITRGRSLVIIVGARRALKRAVENAEVRRRNTLLAQRLRTGRLKDIPEAFQHEARS